jgi:tetratricopeptide (TPR) repeat protein
MTDVNHSLHELANQELDKFIKVQQAINILLKYDLVSLTQFQSPDFANIPSVDCDPPPQQPISQVSEKFIYKAAAESEPELFSLGRAVANESGAEFIAGPMKVHKRSCEKVKNDYGGNWRSLVDVIRCSLVCYDIPHVSRTLDTLRRVVADQDGLVSIKRVKSGFVKGQSAYMTGGYRDVKANVFIKNHIGEIQLHAAGFWEVKANEGHQIYKWVRQYNVSGLNDAVEILSGLSPKLLAEMTKIAKQYASGTTQEESTTYETGDTAEKRRDFWQQKTWELLNLRGLHDEALARARVFLQQRLKRLGETHEAVGQAYNNRGRSLKELGDADGALASFQTALSIRLTSLGEEHPDVAQSYYDIGVVMDKLGRKDEGLQIKTKALHLRQQLFGSSHPTVAKSMCSVGAALRKRGQLVNAVEMFRQALKCQESILASSHPEVAHACNLLGVTLNMLPGLEHKEEAVMYVKKALEIRIGVFGENHPRVARNYWTLGVIQRDSGNMKDAKMSNEKAISIARCTLGENHPDTQKFIQEGKNMNQQPRQVIMVVVLVAVTFPYLFGLFNSDTAAQENDDVIKRNKSLD